MDDLNEFLGAIAATAAGDSGAFIDMLAVLSDFSNTDMVSPEKRAVIKMFVSQNVTL